MLAGIGYGCSYTPPIQALIEWFPDKRGMASGIVIAGFGSGALFFTPMMNMMSAKFAKMPDYLGKSVETITGMAICFHPTITVKFLVIDLCC